MMDWLYHRIHPRWVWLGISITAASIVNVIFPIRSPWIRIPAGMAICVIMLFPVIWTMKGGEAYE